MEHTRRTNGAGEVYQFVDSHYWLLMDIGCSPPKIVSGHETEDEAYDHIPMGWERSYVVTKLDCIRGFKIDTGAEHG
jgi:hypothetical protein